VVTTTNDTPSLVQPESDRFRTLYLMSLAQPQATRSRERYAVAKRLFDVIGSALLVALLSPMMLVIAVVIKATSNGPAVLVQERVGQGGRVFLFYKFRSMYDNPDRTTDERFARDYINGEPNPAAKWEGVFKPANDKRVTPVGRFLRKASLDELPQLFNVLAGDMSLVGPRPSMPYEVEVYKPWHFRRLEVPPGLTGLAQIHGRSNLTFREIVKVDLEYIDQRSFLLDLRILLKTIPVVLSGRGAR